MDAETDTVGDHSLARRLAVTAGELLVELRASWEGEAVDLKDAGDARSHELLMSELRRERPGDAILSEEGADDLARLDAERVWIVDPLDGTREFGERPRDDWAVHVALWERGRLVAGAVARPARGDVLSTQDPPARPTGIPATDPARGEPHPPAGVRDRARRADRCRAGAHGLGRDQGDGGPRRYGRRLRPRRWTV